MQRVTTISARVLAAVLTLAMAMAVLMFSAPQASAHNDGKFEHDDPFEAMCPDTHRSNGRASDGIVGCTPNGFVPIGNDAALCAEARGRVVSGLCTFDSPRACGFSVAFAHDIGGGQCIRPALVPAKYADRSSGTAAVPICIETELVQEQSPSLRVSNTFIHRGVVYQITSGSPACTFNCYNKWDINCDGKLGDFCSVEYDLSKVGDAGKCLADYGIAPTPSE